MTIPLLDLFLVVALAPSSAPDPSNEVDALHHRHDREERDEEGREREPDCFDHDAIVPQQPPPSRDARDLHAVGTLGACSLTATGTCRSAGGLFVLTSNSGGHVPAHDPEVHTMTQYLLSAHSVEGQPREPMTEEQMRAVGARVRALEQEMSSAGALVFGGRLQQPQEATVVRVSGGETLTTDGPFAETKEHLGGFYIIEAASRDDALSWAAKTAGCVSTAIEVRAFWEQSAG
jgi:hypothetical protein